MTRKLIAILGLGLFAAAPASVSAQDGQGSAGRGEVRQIKYDFAPIIIKGAVEKPQVQYFISREKIRDVTPLDLKESFLNRILKAVEKEPF